MDKKPNLTFVSPRFLFPADSGGKIRTTQILRGMKNGVFRITLALPCTAEEQRLYEGDLRAVCDRLITWRRPESGRLVRSATRALWLASRYPMPVVSDWSSEGAAAVAGALAERPDVVVFDFPHSAILTSDMQDLSSVMFTHNVEAEIFERHWRVARNPLYKLVWKNQYQKMRRYERAALSKFDVVVAVSRRDADFFANCYDVGNVRVIPTGVDTDHFRHVLPKGEAQAVFCGSMDWLPNVDAIQFFFDEIWPLVRSQVPHARMRVVGRAPPEAFMKRICSAAPEWEFTGFVADVRVHVAGTDAFVIPLRIGGGTRIKVFEAMAMGVPVVSTGIGTEGLALDEGKHYLRGDTATDFAQHVVTLLRNTALRKALSVAAHTLVQRDYGFRRAAGEFERICLEVLSKRTARSVT